VQGYVYTILLATVLLSGCDKPPANHYRIGMSDAHTLLTHADLSDFIMARQCGILIHAKTEAKNDNEITWHIISEREELFNFTAKFIAVSEEVTQIDILVSKDRNGKEAYDGTGQYQRPAFLQPIRPATVELINSVIQERKFHVDDTENDLVIYPDSTSKIPASMEENSVCEVQRAGLETGGDRFSIHDKPGEFTYGGRLYSE
jgi:hypothetical protein